jgi:hypothetical protein
MAGEQTTSEPSPGGQVLIYQDGALNLQVRLEGQTVWLTQRLIADLYQTSVPNINQHLATIYEDRELDPAATIKKFLIVQTEGSRQVSRTVDHYNLEAIIAVGYRVRSPRGTIFRQWATQRLSELLVKGFVLDDERIKAGRTIGGDYFDELLARIRDIRASERLFYQKITDIYATSIDYDPHANLTQNFFATVQNKLHWAIHGLTAAELVQKRADASRPAMGLKTWKNAPHGPIRKADVMVAKNYLGREEIEELNRVVTMYLDYAEDQARKHAAMHMADWIKKLDAFLAFNERNILTHAGTVSHELAEAHARTQYELYDARRLALEASQHTSDFDRSVVEKMKQLKDALPSLAKPKRTPRKKKAGDA